MKCLLIGLLALAIGRVSFAAGITAEISQMGDSLHLEFRGLSQWDYVVDKKKDQKNSSEFEIDVPPLSESAINILKSWKSSSVESLVVGHEGPDGKDTITIKLKDKNLEAFDYLTDQPSRLIIDIFQSQTEDAKSKKSARKNGKAAPLLSASVNKAKNASLPKKIANIKDQEIKDRKPSSTDLLLVNNQGNNSTNQAPVPSKEDVSGIFDGGDPNFSRFNIQDFEVKEDAIIASQENYYIDFPMLRIQRPELEKIGAVPPLYEITPTDDEENKQARLLLTLFENKRYNVFLKSMEWFNKKYPNSKYNEIVRFMVADVHFAMWLDKRQTQDFDLAMLRYRQALEKYPNSPLMERTQMLMGFATLDRGDYLGTLRMFQEHLRDRPQSPNRDMARLAIADAYLKLGRFDDAAKAYDDIAMEASQKKFQVEASYLRGDVDFQQGNYQSSIDIYQGAINKYPEGAVEFPNAYYNQASAYFKLRRPQESLKTYLNFLKKFPTHSFAGYAMTRVGELLDIMGIDKARVMGAYLETQFRYGNGPSSIVARLHLVANRMKSMKENEVDKAVADVLELTKKSSLAEINQFSIVLIAEGYTGRGDYEKAIAMLVKFYQANPTTADTQLLSNRIIKDINLEIKSLVDSGNFIQGLKTHNKYADSWLKGSERIDTKYNVARAFEQAGVFKESEKLYRDTLNKILALKGTQIEKERNIFEKLPSTDELQLRLAETNLQLGNFVSAYEHMKEIKNPEQLTDIQQIERVGMAAQLLEKKGDFSSATRYLVELIKTWKGVPVLVAPEYLQLAQLEIKYGKKDDAIDSLKKVDQLMMDSQGKVPADVHAKALETLANLYSEKGQGAKALETNEQLLAKYETSRPLASIRYKVGQTYFQKGDLQKAADVWNGLKNDKSEVWYELAQEQLKNSDWNNEYKKYIKRIPAMSERN